MSGKIAVTAHWIIALGLLLAAATVGAADYEAGIKAYQQGRYNKALRQFRPLAENGHAGAQIHLGMVYSQGQGIGSHTIRRTRYMRLARQGRICAQYNLGGMFNHYKGLPDNDPQAIKWIRKAAESGFAEAQFYLGLTYYYGEGVLKKIKTRLRLLPRRWFTYYHGEGLPKNDRQAVNWFRKAAENGHAKAQYTLGWMYASGRGVRSVLCSWFNKLKLIYANGEGVPKDSHQALDWFRKAAAREQAFAQYTLGEIYANGDGVVKDKLQALEWFRKSATNGYAKAQYTLGEIYANGDGVPEDNVQGYAWYYLVANRPVKGRKHAREALAAIRKDAEKELAAIKSRMTTDQISEAERLSRKFKNRISKIRTQKKR